MTPCCSHAEDASDIPVKRSLESELSSPSRPADTSLGHSRVSMGGDKQLRGGVYSSPMPLAKSKHKVRRWYIAQKLINWKGTAMFFRDGRSPGLYLNSFFSKFSGWKIFHLLQAIVALYLHFRCYFFFPCAHPWFWLCSYELVQCTELAGLFWIFISTSVLWQNWWRILISSFLSIVLS